MQRADGGTSALPLQLPGGNVRGRGQRLRGPESRRRRGVPVGGRGLGRVAVHVQVCRHRLRAAAHQVGEGQGPVSDTVVTMLNQRNE